MSTVAVPVAAYSPKHDEAPLPLRAIGSHVYVDDGDGPCWVSCASPNDARRVAERINRAEGRAP